MDTSYVIILFTTSVFFIICLVMMGIMLVYKKQQYAFPNVQNQCPDNWPASKDLCVYVPKGLDTLDNSIDYTGNGSHFDKHKRRNDILRLQHLGNNNGSLKTLEDFIQSQKDLDSKQKIWEFDKHNYGIRFSENATICDKRKWANFYGIKWDGVTNFNNCNV